MGSIAADTRLEPVETSSDLAYVRLAAAGDQRAFAYLFESRIDRVSRYVWTLLHNREAVEDTVANVFVSVWRNLGKLRDIERFDAWLFRIAHNKAVETLRQQEEARPA
jgi:RNA polymerase sigma-70 factor (ECF subfamily)